MLGLSRNAALSFGPFLAAIELWRRWGNWSDWLSVFDDVFAGALLVTAALLAARIPVLLVAAWGYATHMMLMSVLYQVTEVHQPDASGYPGSAVVFVKVVFLATCCIGLVSAVAASSGPGSSSLSTIRSAE